MTVLFVCDIDNIFQSRFWLVEKEKRKNIHTQCTNTHKHKHTHIDMNNL